MGQAVEVFSILLANKVYHKSAHNNMEDMQSVVRVILVIPEDCNPRRLRVWFSISIVHSELGEPFVDELIESGRLITHAGFSLEMYVVLILWVVHDESVPQPRGVECVLLCWSTGE